MPGYREVLETGERWKRLPGLETVPSGAALTFDDGPDSAGTPQVLDALDAAGVRATFFLVGEQLMRNHAIAREAAARGHELALHCYEHAEQDSLRPQAVRDDIARALGAFEASTGRRPRFLRPPYGRFSEPGYDACRHLGLEPVYWSSWGMDWEPIPGERVADLALRGFADGAIVLLHDSVRYGHRPDTQPTADAVSAIAARAGELGVRLAPLGELV
ncbi:MAG: peptidoglycan-N-acetylglucosamine deacetylase [Thermoleophilaceae bacterium]|nr:peptidoglycan-N-acetylglucosamine deacetylase [Thermoleophilaceae bacterium]